MQDVGVNGSFWAGRRVFVTGHTGFFGGWLCAWLDRAQAEVTGYSLAPPTRPSFYVATGLGGRVRSEIADVRDAGRLSRAVADARAEIVFHLAAQPLVRLAFDQPVETFDTNVMGTVNLLQAIRSAPSVAAAVVVTTDKVYDNVEWHWGYRESDRLGGREPYGASKAAAEAVVDAFRHAYLQRGARRIGVATVRAGNLIGGGDWAADRLIPDAMRAFAGGAPLSLRNPRAVRPWQHVLDPVRGLLMLAERLAAAPSEASGAWNMGPPEHESHSVADIADAVVRLWGGGARWCAAADSPAAARESRVLALSSMKARNELGWRPAWSIDQALMSTISWYRAHLADRDMWRYSLAQVDAIENAARGELPDWRSGASGADERGRAAGP
jgi:CDP-glucose 4,6-dehydratase